MMRSQNARLAFVPSPQARDYFDQLSKRLTVKRGIKVHVTQREVFDRMVDYARRGEKAELGMRHLLRPPIQD